MGGRILYIGDRSNRKCFIVFAYKELRWRSTRRERFSKELGIDLKLSEGMSTPAGRHQTVFHLLLTCHNNSLLLFVPYYTVIELVHLRKVLIVPLG